MGKLIKIIIILVVVLMLIFLIGKGAEFWTLKKLEQTGISFSKEELQQILKQRALDEITYKEWVSPDGKLKLEYPSNWIEVKNLEKFIPEISFERYDLKYLFLAQKIEVGKFAQLIVQEMMIEIDKTFEEIIEEMKESNLQEGLNMKIITSTTTEENFFVFEAKYENKIDFHSKEKIIFLEPKKEPVSASRPPVIASQLKENKKVYLIAVIGLEKDWPDLKEEANSIINSVQIY